MKASKRVHLHLDETSPSFHLEATATSSNGNARHNQAPSPDSSPCIDGAASDTAAKQPAKPALYGEASLAQEFAEKFGLTDDELFEDEPAEQRSPLTWFGFMVPQALKTSQSSFEKALEVSVQLAGVQSELRMLQQ